MLLKPNLLKLFRTSCLFIVGLQINRFQGNSVTVERQRNLRLSSDIMERKRFASCTDALPLGSNHPLPKPSATIHKIGENPMTPLPLPCGCHK